MIIQYDTRPDATIDEKLRSLIKSVQLAFGEIDITAQQTSTSADLSSLMSQVQQISSNLSALSSAVNTAIGSLNDSISGLSDRVTVLEGRQPLPDAPAEDGAYKLTVTVTEGVPVYTWELG